MTIDIVDLQDPKYSNLTPVMLAMVREAQKQKNALLASAAAAKKKMFERMVRDNVVHSSTREFEEEAIDKRTQKKIESLKSDLDYQLAYEGLAMEGNEYGPYRYPENPNPNLAPAQRFLAVRQYYMDVTNDANARLQAYSMDELARTYLGDYYRTLYDLLATYCK